MAVGFLIARRPASNNFAQENGIGLSPASAKCESVARAYRLKFHHQRPLPVGYAAERGERMCRSINSAIFVLK